MYKVCIIDLMCEWMCTHIHTYTQMHTHIPPRTHAKLTNEQGAIYSRMTVRMLPGISDHAPRGHALKGP